MHEAMETANNGNKKLKEENDILIQKYFDGQLEPSELSAFNAKLASDNTLKEDFEIYQKMYDHLDTKKTYESGIDALQAHNDKVCNPSTSNKSKLLWFLIPIILGVIVLLYLGNKPVQKLTNNEIFAAHFEHEKISEKTKGTNDRLKILAALDLYNDKKYKEAADGFKEIENSNYNVKLAYAISLMQISKEEEAQVILDELELVEVYKNAARWYQALVMVKTENVESAKIKLSQIETDSYYFDKAIKLNKSLTED